MVIAVLKFQISDKSYDREFATEKITQNKLSVPVWLVVMEVIKKYQINENREILNFPNIRTRVVGEKC